MFKSNQIKLNQINSKSKSNLTSIKIEYEYANWICIYTG